MQIVGFSWFEIYVMADSSPAKLQLQLHRELQIQLAASCGSSQFVRADKCLFQQYVPIALCEFSKLIY
jgi:hypothetical protein